jgi:hypothetical protein
LFSLLLMLYFLYHLLGTLFLLTLSLKTILE